VIVNVILQKKYHTKNDPMDSILIQMFPNFCGLSIHIFSIQKLAGYQANEAKKGQKRDDCVGD